MTTSPRTLDIARIESVYSGKPGHCCCGCAGTHSHSARSIKIIAGKMNALLAHAAEDPEPGAPRLLEQDGSFIAIDTPTRRYIAYLIRD